MKDEFCLIIKWGPPGTGKTKLCEVICKKAGIELVVEPLSSSELNRSKVGETEQLLMALFGRAERLPYLLCCIAIDEVDALTPKRNEKTGEHKVDVLCLLLSLIGGIKDVPNVFVIASTNRLNKMDEAFCRRLQTKFFVGRLGPQKRLEILSKIRDVQIKNKNVNLPKILYPYTQQLTINFSGAAIESFRSRLVSYLYNRDLNGLTVAILTDIANQVARDFQILLGAYSIPTLISTSNPLELPLTPLSKRYTGRILIDMSDEEKCLIQVEYEDEKTKKRVVEEFDNFSNVKQPHEAIPILLKMGIKEKVDFVQMFDTSMLLNNAAFDDNTVMEIVLEKKGEWEQYPTAMAIFDADSLVGINENLSDSSMGQSSSKSITNNRLWHQVVIQTANSKLEDPNEKTRLTKEKDDINAKFEEVKNKLNEETIKKTREQLEQELLKLKNDYQEKVALIAGCHKWVVVITKNSFISTQFKALASFPFSKAEIKRQKEDAEDRVCVNCEMLYKNCKNGLGDCNYHDGPLVDIRVPKFYAVTKDELTSSMVNSMDTDRSKTLQNYMFLCCFQQHMSAGCKRGYHCDDETKSSKNFEKYGVEPI